MISTRGTVIESIGVYLPPKVVSTDEVLAGCAKAVAFPLERMTGIHSRRMAGETVFSIDLAEQAARDCLVHSRHAPSSVGLIICCTISRCDGPGPTFSFEPSTSVKLKQRLGLDGALAFDVANACAGMFTGIAIADAFLHLGEVDCALVVSGEYITHLTGTAQKEIEGFLDPRLACLTLGDAGAAVMLERSASPNIGFRALEMYTLGRYAPLCVAKETDREHGGAIMFTDAVALTAATQQHALLHAEHLRRRRGWSIADCQHLIMHQTSKLTLDSAVREINKFYGPSTCDEHTAINNLAERGNTASTSYFVALKESILRGRIRSDDTILFSITGSGLTIGTAFYTLDDLPDRMRAGDGAEAPESSRGDQLGHAAARPGVLPLATAPRVRIAGVGTSTMENGTGDSAALAQRAVQGALADAARGPRDIALLVYSGMFRNELLYEPAMAAIIAGNADLNANAASPDEPTTLAFDIFGGALGFLDGCHVATRMIGSGAAASAVVATSEVDWNARGDGEPALGVSEVGSAIVLEPSRTGEGFGTFAHRYLTDRVQAHVVHSVMRGGRTTLRVRRDPDTSQLLLELIPVLVHQTLQAEGLDLDAVAIIFPPQHSSEFIAQLAERLGIPKDRLVDVVRGDQDLYTSALPYALREARDRHLVRAGEVGLMIGVAAGLRVSCATYHF